MKSKEVNKPITWKKISEEQRSFFYIPTLPRPSGNLTRRLTSGLQLLYHTIHTSQHNNNNNPNLQTENIKHESQHQHKHTSDHLPILHNNQILFHRYKLLHPIGQGAQQ